MAARLVLLVGLMVAALCVSEVAAGRQLIDLDVDVDVNLNVDLNVKLSVVNDAARTVVVRLLDAKDKALQVKERTVESLGPVQVKVGVARLLDVEVAVVLGASEDGQVVKGVAKVDLSRVRALVTGVVEVVLRVVEDATAGVVKVLRGDEVLVTIVVSAN